MVRSLARKIRSAARLKGVDFSSWRAKIQIITLLTDLFLLQNRIVTSITSFTLMDMFAVYFICF
jgi:hypothetical protein